MPHVTRRSAFGAAAATSRDARGAQAPLSFAIAGPPGLNTARARLSDGFWERLNWCQAPVRGPSPQTQRRESHRSMEPRRKGGPHAYSLAECEELTRDSESGLFLAKSVDYSLDPAKRGQKRYLSDRENRPPRNGEGVTMHFDAWPADRTAILSEFNAFGLGNSFTAGCSAIAGGALGLLATGAAAPDALPLAPDNADEGNSEPLVAKRLKPMLRQHQEMSAAKEKGEVVRLRQQLEAQTSRADAAEASLAQASQMQSDPDLQTPQAAGTRRQCGSASPADEEPSPEAHGRDQTNLAKLR